LNELESAIAAKMACWEAGSSQTTKAQPGACASSGSALVNGKQQTAGLNELESAIDAKLARWKASVFQTAKAEPGAYAASGHTLVNGKQQTAGLNELESAIASKIARWEAGANVNTLEDSFPAEIGSQDIEPPFADNEDAKVQAHMPGSNSPCVHLESSEETVQPTMRTNGREGAESHSARATTRPFVQLRSKMTPLQAKLCSNSGDSVQGKSMDWNIAVQSSASAPELHVLDATVQSKMNSGDEATASMTLLFNFESESICKQHLDSETADVLGEASATHPIPQDAGEGVLNNDDRVESKVPQNDSLYEPSEGADHGPDSEDIEYGNLETAWSWHLPLKKRKIIFRRPSKKVRTSTFPRPSSTIRIQNLP
jgi:hypothetical protein